jgi:hypothetical protein
MRDFSVLLIPTWRQAEWKYNPVHQLLWNRAALVSGRPPPVIVTANTNVTALRIRL